MEQFKLKTIEEIIEYAYKEVNEAYDYYETKAKQSINVELRSIWQQLANDKLKQKAAFDEMSEKIHKGNTTDFVEIPEHYQEEFLNISGREFSEEEKAIVTAINKDNENMRLYKELARSINDSVWANVLLNFSYMEYIHKKNLIREINQANFFV